MQKHDINALRQAAEDLHNQDSAYRNATNLDFILYILLVVVVAISLRTFVAEPIRVDGISMYPTLLDRERMVVEKLTYYTSRPERGDIIVCFYPGYTISCVKRVIGLPGDVVEVKDGQIFLNGAALDERAYLDVYMYDTMPAHTVQQGHVFVAGDNRNYSGDSRDPHVGDIPYEKIVGKAVYVMWPLDSIRRIAHVDYATA